VLAHLYDTVRRRRIPMGWVRGLAFGVSPIEARHFAGARAGAGFTVALQGVARSRLGRLAVRGLARTRRRLRVHEATEAAPH